ncbi:MAG TPA: FAD:protein FMN transferase [Gemmatimonadaceae bacterium]
MSASLTHTTVAMDTVVTIQVIDQGTTSAEQMHRDAAVERALGWFRAIESHCTRFDPVSELRVLCTQVGRPVSASAVLIETVRFAIALAEETDGAFDPTVGRRMEARGFDRNYKTGKSSATGEGAGDASYRDVYVDAIANTITLDRPLLLDLGAVAKGFAIDMAARELAEFEHFAIDAGGDLFLAGRNEQGEPWSIGIRHPRDDDQLLESLTVSNAAVCTSGDYERRQPGTGHHIVDPETGDAALQLASVTVIAPIAMVADGLATAAFVLGPKRGLALLERHGVRGILVTPTLDRYATADAATLL